MKKDMAGAATALALAHMIMARELKVRLRVIVPAVENSISGTSFRPRDIYTSRKGISVEIGNTDAEGRLILADALALADEDKPALIVDFATLTGAARVALGPDLPPFFTDDDALAAEFARRGAAENDPVWRMPLWRPYESMLDSKVADHQQCRHRRPWRRHHRGAVPAPLRRRAKSWLHLDIFAWTPSAKPGRPEGADASRRARFMPCSRRAIHYLWSRSIPASTRSAPKSRRAIWRARSRPHALSRARAIRSSSRPRPCGARRRTKRGSTPKRCSAKSSPSTTSTDEGWAWGQLETDGYVGWLSANALAAPGRRRHTRLRCRARFRFPAPDIKRPPLAALPMGAQLAVARQDERFAVTAAGWLCAGRPSHAAQGARERDFVAVAEKFLGTPYLWGGKTASGSTARASCRSRCRRPASPARATATCRSWRSANRRRSPTCAAAI